MKQSQKLRGIFLCSSHPVKSKLYPLFTNSFAQEKFEKTFPNKKELIPDFFSFYFKNLNIWKESNAQNLCVNFKLSRQQTWTFCNNLYDSLGKEKLKYLLILSFLKYFSDSCLRHPPYVINYVTASTSVADPWHFEMDPDQKKFLTDPDQDRNLIQTRIQAQTIQVRIQIQAKNDSVPGKSKKMYKNAHFLCIVCIYYLTFS